MLHLGIGHYHDWSLRWFSALDSESPRGRSGGLLIFQPLPATAPSDEILERRFRAQLDAPRYRWRPAEAVPDHGRPTQRTPGDGPRRNRGRPGQTDGGRKSEGVLIWLTQNKGACDEHSPHSLGLDMGSYCRPGVPNTYQRLPSFAGLVCTAVAGRPRAAAARNTVAPLSARLINRAMTSGVQVLLIGVLPWLH